MEKAPDKIYVAEAMETEKGLFGLWTDKDHRDTPYVEYIRKDALLEWAKETEKSRMRVPVEAYNNEDYQAGFIDGFAKFRRILIEKLESL